MSTAGAKLDEVPAFVLHSYAYKETSLIVDALTSTHGRIALVAKGAKRPGSVLRGVLLPFQPLAMSATGKGEVRTLTRAEWQPGQALLLGSSVMVAYYVNELVLKLVPRDDALPELFEAYTRAISALSRDEDRNICLRRFELQLLAALGYGLDLTRCAASGEPVRPAGQYVWQAERGIVNAAVNNVGQARELISGSTLLSLAQPELMSAQAAAEAKPFMRGVLDVHLERRALASRQMMRDLHALTESVNDAARRRRA